MPAALLPADAQPTLPSAQHDDDELRKIAQEFRGASQDLEKILRTLEERRCPLSHLPVDQCQRCVAGDPRHYPFAVTRTLREIAGRYHRAVRFLLALAGRA